MEKATTIVKETSTLDRYAVMAFDGKTWEQVKVGKDKKSRNDFEFFNDAMDFGQKLSKKRGYKSKKLKVVKLTEVQTTTVTTMIGDDMQWTIGN